MQKAHLYGGLADGFVAMVGDDDCICVIQELHPGQPRDALNPNELVSIYCQFEGSDRFYCVGTGSAMVFATGKVKSVVFE